MANTPVLWTACSHQTGRLIVTLHFTLQDTTLLSVLRSFLCSFHTKWVWNSTVTLLWTVHRCFVIEYQKPNHSGDAHLMLPDVSGNVSVVWAHHVISANDARLFVNSPRNLHSNTPTEASMLFTGPSNFWTIYDGSSCVMGQSARCKLMSQDKASLTMLGSDLGV